MTPKKKEVEVKLRISDRKALLRRMANLQAYVMHPRVHEMNTLFDTPEGTLASRGQMLRIRVERRLAGRRPSPNGALRRGKEVVTITYKGPLESGSAMPWARGASASSMERQEEGVKDRQFSTQKQRAGAQKHERPPQRQYKIRDEREVQVANAEASAQILAAFGLVPGFRYEKYRTTYRLPDSGELEIDFDETPIGDFLELEGSRTAIDRAARRLGFSPLDYIVESYAALYAQQFPANGHTNSQNGPPAVPRLPDMLFPRGGSRRSRKGTGEKLEKRRETARNGGTTSEAIVRPRKISLGRQHLRDFHRFHPVFP